MVVVVAAVVVVGAAAASKKEDSDDDDGSSGAFGSSGPPISCEGLRSLRLQRGKRDDRRLYHECTQKRSPAEGGQWQRSE